MAISARLTLKTRLALSRYCKTHLTKTQALKRGIALLLVHEGHKAEHPAFSAFQRLCGTAEQAAAQLEQESVDTLKRHLDERYPA